MNYLHGLDVLRLGLVVRLAPPRGRLEVGGDVLEHTHLGIA